MTPCAREAFVRDHIDLRGEDDRAYRFMLVKDGRPLSPMGGNFAYVIENKDSFEVVLVGEAQNLSKDAQLRWDEAVLMYGAPHMYMRLNISEGVRQREHADIIAQASPPMNVGEASRRAG
jgi:hypothetical protein